MCLKFKCSGMEPGGDDSVIDRLFFRDNKLCAAAEIKSREMSMEDLRGYGSYLVTYEKLLRGVAIAHELGVPYFLIVRLLKSGTIVFWGLDTESLRDLEVRNSKTDATCNGGTAWRENAYLPLDTMKVLHAGEGDDQAGAPINYNAPGDRDESN